MVGDQSGDASAERFTADHQSPPAAECADHRKLTFDQHRRRARREALALAALSLHIGEFKARHAMPGVGDTFGKCVHEGRIHRHAGAVRENDGQFRIFRKANDNAVQILVVDIVNNLFL